MTYQDNRELDEKLLEHRRWNTLELEIESAADTISSNLLAAMQKLIDNGTDESGFSFALQVAFENQDGPLADGLVRLGILCSNETPNRFKALFPAYLLQEGMAKPERDKMRWPGFSRLAARNITVEALAKVFLSGTGGTIPRDHFAKWISEKGGFEAIKEICSLPILPRNFIYSVSLRLAQGADTNRRGHSATDIIKNRLRILGFTPELGNTNTSDVAVSALVDDYDGPRKFDTVIWNARGSVVLVCQSQMYSSDVGSIQGKTVEEDYEAISRLRARWSNLTALTNTEGFGCHTTMLSRLKHVLNSRIDGFIQLRTLDSKLRYILHEVGCASLVDFEIELLKSPRATLTTEELISVVVAKHNFNNEEVSAAFSKFQNFGLINVDDDRIYLQPERASVAAYFFFIDQVSDSSRPVVEIAQPAVCIGGLPLECAVGMDDFEKLKDEVSDLLKRSGFSSDEFDRLVKASQVFDTFAI